MRIAAAIYTSASIATMALLAWQIGRSALITTSLNAPLLSSRPCVLVLACVPFLLAAAALWLIRRG